MMRASHGFTLVESLVALALTLLIVSGAAALAVTSDRLARSESRVMDTQQRARVIAETLGRDLQLVGAGVDRGPMSGPLSQTFAPLWPRRVGRIRPDGTRVVRDDAVTLVHVPDTVVQTTLAFDRVGTSRIVLSECPGRTGPCRVTTGNVLALFTPPGRVDLLGVVSEDIGGVTVAPLASATGPFVAGTPVVEVVVRGFYFDQTASQLRYYDGDRTDQPVVDDVVGLSFEYFGDPIPPRWPRPVPGTANCRYDAAGVWRGGVSLQPGADGLAALPLAMFGDGPWCGSGDTEFDADVLRIRRVRVTVRLRPPGPGDPQGDQRIVFDVSPPNLALNGRFEGPGV